MNDAQIIYTESVICILDHWIGNSGIKIDRK